MRYTYVIDSENAQGLVMEVLKFTVVLAAAVTLGACGFKSDLSIPEDAASPDELFVPDESLVEAELPAGELEERPPFLPTGEEGVEVPLTDDEIVIDKVTTTASDGDILVNADAESDIVTTSVDNSSEAEVEPGVEVDISDIATEIGSERLSQ